MQVPPESQIPGDTGYEECIVPTDMNLLSGNPLCLVIAEDMDKGPPNLSHLVTSWSGVLAA